MKWNESWNEMRHEMKWYEMNHELRIWNQVKLRSSQLRTEAWKIRDFNGVWIPWPWPREVTAPTPCWIFQASKIQYVHNCKDHSSTSWKCKISAWLSRWFSRCQGQLVFPVSVLNFSGQLRFHVFLCWICRPPVKLALEQGRIFKLIFTLSGATTVPCFYAEFFRGNYGSLFFVLNLSASCKISAGTKPDFQADFHVVRGNYGFLFLWWIF